jgi:hypothetical protein
MSTLLAIMFLLCVLSAHSLELDVVGFSKIVPLPRQLDEAGWRFSFPEGHPLEFAHHNDSLIHPHDTLRLHFKALNRTFYVHLEPNADLIHADIHEAAVDAEEYDDAYILSHTRAYHGTVFTPASRDVVDLDKVFLTAPTLEGSFEAVGDAEIVVFGHGGYQKYFNPAIDSHEHHFSHLSFQGSVSVGVEDFDIKTFHNYHVTKQDHHPSLSPSHSNSIVVSQLNDKDVTTTSCAFSTDQLPAQEAKRRKVMAKQSLFKRDNDGCSKLQGAKITVVGDCNYVKKFNGKEESLKHITSVVNKGSRIYKRDLKVTVSIADSVFKEECGGESWNTGCNGFSMNNVLPKFQSWVGQRAKKNIAYNNLFTACR